MLGTWAELSFSPDGRAWGDISLLEGNDGGAMIQSLDGYYKARGFTFSLLENAPAAVWAQKSTGAWCLDKLVGVDANNVTLEWERQFLDP